MDHVVSIFHHRHSVKYNQKQMRNKKSDVVERQHAISVMNKRSPFAVPTSAAILKRSRRLKIFVHLCQLCHFFTFIPNSTRMGPCVYLYHQHKRDHVISVRVKTGLAQMKVLVWKDSKHTNSWNYDNSFLIYVY